MVDIELLKAKVEERGIPVAVMCRRADINKFTYYNRLKGKGNFTIPEATSISRVLGLSDEERSEIFFANKVECKTT